jgi:dienelactone hydrolase
MKRAIVSTVGIIALGLVVGWAQAQVSPAPQAQQASTRPSDSQPTDEQRAIEQARALLRLLVAGEFERFVQQGDTVMKQNFTVEQARRIWTQLEARNGAYQGEELVRVSEVGPYREVRFILRFERQRQPFRIVVNQQGLLSGIWVDPVELPPEYQPPDYVDQKAFREEKVTVSAGQYQLPGTVSVPTGAGPFAAIVLVHGSGPHDQDETVGACRPFRDLAWGLASRGILVLRYEKRTRAHPLAKPADEWTFADETIDDAVAAVELLRKRPDVAAERIFVAGHSLGGVAAPYIAQRVGRLGGLILLCASARSILDLLEDQTDYLARLDGKISEEEQRQIERLRKITAAIRAGQLEDAAPVLGMPPRYLAELHRLDPVSALAKLDVPVLLIHGGRDYQVTQADFERWQQGLAGRQNATLRRLEALNHLLVAGAGRSTPEEYQQAGHVDRQVIELIADWVAEQSGKP